MLKPEFPMNEPFSIREANALDLPLIGELAGRIWPETYAPILDPAQIDYMMELIYSPDSLEEQILDGHRFIISDWYNLPCGFADYSRLHAHQVVAADTTPAGAGELWKLNKIYLDPLLQGKGLGKKLLTAVCEMVLNQGGKRLSLNVNKFNPARKFYEKQGFMIVREEDIDIGQGYFMNDYVMEKGL